MAEEVDNIADYDKYIASKIIFPTKGEYLQNATVMGRVKDGTGRERVHITQIHRFTVGDMR